MTIINSVIKGGGGSAPAYYIEKTKDANNKLVNGTTVIDLTGVTDVGDYVCVGQYYGVSFPSNTNISFPSLTTLSGANALGSCFSYCTGLTSISFSSLTTLSGANAMQSCFANCTDLTSIDLSSLTTISGGSAMQNCFFGCIGLTSVSFPALTTLTGNGAMQSCFFVCTSLTSVSFPALTSTSFGSNTNQFNNMLLNVTGCTVHFPSNLQSVIGSWASVTAGFGGTNTTVLFDLPATE